MWALQRQRWGPPPQPSSRRRDACSGCGYKPPAPPRASHSGDRALAPTQSRDRSDLGGQAALKGPNARIERRNARMTTTCGVAGDDRRSGTSTLYRWIVPRRRKSRPGLVLCRFPVLFGVVFGEVFDGAAVDSVDDHKGAAFGRFLHRIGQDAPDWATTKSAPGHLG
jgi:hypothetical protein